MVHPERSKAIQAAYALRQTEAQLAELDTLASANFQASSQNLGTCNPEVYAAIVDRMTREMRGCVNGILCAHTARIPPQGGIVDFGAGEANFYSGSDLWRNIIDQQRLTLIPIEPSRQALHNAYRNGRLTHDEHARAICSSEPPYPIADNSVDAVVSISTLHTIAGPESPKYFRELHRILRPGGSFVHVQPVGVLTSFLAGLPPDAKDKILDYIFKKYYPQGNTRRPTEVAELLSKMGESRAAELTAGITNDSQYNQLNKTHPTINPYYRLILRDILPAKVLRTIAVPSDNLTLDTILRYLHTIYTNIYDHGNRVSARMQHSERASTATSALNSLSSLFRSDAFEAYMLHGLRDTGFIDVAPSNAKFYSPQLSQTDAHSRTLSFLLQAPDVTLRLPVTSQRAAGSYAQCNAVVGYKPQ